ncbi:Macrolide export protein MacA [Vibrio mediterranei]|uniref:efflux RND transporter periplasmic adaptor subunit n=1 Tax=Vibrio mediterranei TaxID=689 RepID=UPI0007848E49|nr:efflux RND transporter periplasmic adaptor subunit [Vibrio mediterranei]SBO12510.1 Macrolide export protein MacA [Vibrio mediterranei]
MNKNCAALVALFASVLTGCTDDVPVNHEEPLRPVRVTHPVAELPLAESRYAGTTESSENFTLSFRISGQVRQIDAVIGEVLSEKDPIAALDDKDMQLNLEQAKAQLVRAETKAVTSKSNLTRLTELYKKHVVSKKDFELGQAESKADIARVKQARKSVELAEQQISYTKLSSPIAGCKVTQSYVRENENVSSGQPIADLSCGSAIEVTATIPDTAVKDFNIGENVKVALKGSINKTVQGRVTEIGITSDENGLYFVKVTLVEENPEFQEGVAAEVIALRSLNAPEGHYWVPMSAVNERQGGNYLYVYEEADNNNGVVKQLDVNIGRFSHGYIEVLNGLGGQEVVVTAGVSQIYDGLKVTKLSEAK